MADCTPIALKVVDVLTLEHVSKRCDASLRSINEYIVPIIRCHRRKETQRVYDEHDHTQEYAKDDISLSGNHY